MMPYSTRSTTSRRIGNRRDLLRGSLGPAKMGSKGPVRHRLFLVLQLYRQPLAWMLVTKINKRVMQSCRTLCYPSKRPLPLHPWVQPCAGWEGLLTAC